MNAPEFRKYSLVECQIVRHQHYGLVVSTILGGRSGFVDESAISDEPYTPSSDWPRVGEELLGVVLGETVDGRLRLSSRPRDVALARAVGDVEVALMAWRQIRDDVNGVESRLSEFLKSSEAVPILRWAKSRPLESIDRVRALEIIAIAPESLARDLRD